MKLYGHLQSTCTRKVLLTLAEKGWEAQFVEIDAGQGAQRRPAHLARHPFGEVPVLEDRGFTLYESGAIIRYLDAVLPGRALTPSAAQERARVDQWLSVEAAYCAKSAWTLLSELRLGPKYGQAPDGIEVQEARRELGHTFDVLDRALEGGTYLVADAFSLADVSFLPMLQLLVDLQQSDLMLARGNVARWWERLRARPSWRKVLAQGAPQHASLPSACA